MVFGLVSLPSFIANSFGILLAAFYVTRAVYSELDDPRVFFLLIPFLGQRLDQQRLWHLSSSTLLYNR